MKKYIVIALAALSLTSCDDFLDRKPLDFGNEDSYFQSPEDLMLSVNAFYEYLPKNKELWGGLYTEDVVSDNQASAGAQNLFYKGDKMTVKMGKNSSEWNFENLRAINFFINKAEARLESGALTGNIENINQYLGEGYFFRAFDYFRLLRKYGDAPIITEMLPDDLSTLAAASKRSPRNEVVRFILKDLDHAIELMKESEPASGRVYRDVAQAFKARVALYEATWEKYHAGTCFVPGNSKWVGNKVWPDFKFEAGSAEAEINFFLDEAIKAAEAAADKHPLCDDYISMFNNWESEFASDHEVIFARYYKSGILAHSCSSYLKGGGGCNPTRAMVNTYLMTSGLPIYADPNYLGDEESYFEFQNRDERLTSSVRPCGNQIEAKQDPETGKWYNDTIYYHRPNILNSGNEKATTGYELEKWVSHDRIQATQYLNTSAVPLIRSAECRLVYMEAYYERHGSLNDKAKKYWKELRKRAGVDEDFTKTINATDLEKENDLAIWSHGKKIDVTLYNIRRERRCELMSEGQRLDDLKRWRSLDNMVNYQPEGMNLWDKQWEMYGNSIKDSGAVSNSGVSKYIRPLQISATSKAYDGYTFPKPHYLEPIPITEFTLTGGLGTTLLYQNPGWPDKVDGTADYSYDCD